jgi:hypothetical protein
MVTAVVKQGQMAIQKMEGLVRSGHGVAFRQNNWRLGLVVEEKSPEGR